MRHIETVLNSTLHRLQESEDGLQLSNKLLRHTRARIQNSLAAMHRAPSSAMWTIAPGDPVRLRTKASFAFGTEAPATEGRAEQPTRAPGRIAAKLICVNGVQFVVVDAEEFQVLHSVAFSVQSEPALLARVERGCHSAVSEFLHTAAAGEMKDLTWMPDA